MITFERGGFDGRELLFEGIQKFLFRQALGVGRFMKIGIPWPEFMATFVGIVEIVCGTLLVIGFLTRLAATPRLIDICVALYSTKLISIAKNGVWSTLHEARTDVSMLLGLIFLLLRVADHSQSMPVLAGRGGTRFLQWADDKSPYRSFTPCSSSILFAVLRIW